MKLTSNLKACAILLLSHAIVLSTLVLTPTQAFSNPLKAWLPGGGSPEPTVPAIPALGLLTIGNPIVIGGNTATGRITLTAPAPAGGAVVQLSGNIPAATVPPSVTVPAGQTVKVFYIKTVPVTTQQSGQVNATFGALTANAPLTVRPIGVQSVTFASPSVIGGNNATCTVILERPAAPGNIRVTLGSSNTNLAAPTVPSLLFTVGARSLSFGVRTFSTSTNKTVDITATANGTTKSGRLTLLPRVTNCTYSITPASKQFTAAAGTGSVAVTASNAACSWTAAKNTNVNWLTITSGSNGSGNGTVNYSVLANTSATSRSVVLTIAGKSHTVTQAGVGACSFSISPTSKQFTSAAGTGSVAVTAGSTCHWTATKVGVINWLTITSGSSGTGNGTVNYSVTANTATTSRTATLDIGGQTYTVTQAGTGTTTCAFTLLPDIKATVRSSGESGQLAVDTTTGCSWTAVSNAPWLTITRGPNGDGAGIVVYNAAANTGTTSRTGTMTIGGKIFTVTQAANGNNLTLTLSKSTAEPGQILTVHGSGFNATAITSVVFSSANGFRNEMPATSVTSTDISVLIPVFFDPVLFQLASGAVSVTVLQKAGAVVKSFGPVSGLTVNLLATVPTSAGAITMTVLKQVQEKLDDTVADWQRIQTASQGSADATALLANLAGMKTALHNQELVIQKVMNGTVPSVSIGNVNGRNVTIDSSTLLVMDRIYAAYLLNTPINLRPTRQSKAATVERTRNFMSPQAINDLPQQIATVIAGLVASSPGTTFESGKRLQSIGSSLIGSGNTAAVVLTGETSVPTGTGPLMAAMLWNATTWSPLAISTTLRSIDLQMEARTATVSDFQSEGTFASTSATEGAALITNGLKPMDQLTTDGQTMSAVKTQVSKIPVHFAFNNPASVGSQVQTNFTAIVENLPPRNAAITVGDNGTAADDVFRIFLDSVLLGQTTTGGTSTLQVNGISSGSHALAVTCLDDGAGGADVCTLQIDLSQGLTFTDGTTSLSDLLDMNETRTYTILAP